MNDNAQRELEAMVADAVRDGYRVESQVGSTVVISRKKPVSVLWSIVRIAIIVVLTWIALTITSGNPGIGLIFLALPVLMILLWVKDAKTQLRFQIRIDDNGEVIQERV